MKPKTKLQVEIIKKSQQLNPKKQIMLKYANQHWLIHKGYATKNRVACMECGGKFSTDLVKNNKAICPHCNTKLSIEQSRLTTFQQKIFAGFAQIVDNFQVVRYFEISSDSRSGGKANYHCYEILQHWIREDGKSETVARIHTINWYCDSWSGGQMEIRKDYGRQYHAGNKYDVYTDNFHPKSEFKPEYERYGIDKNLAGLSFMEAKRIIPDNPQAETLLKAGQYDLLSLTTQSAHLSKIRRYWSSIKICFRNHYIVKDATMWFDYIELLQYFNLDLHNAHYVCPIDLKVEHDKLMDRKRKIQLREKIERQRQKLAEDQVKYARQKGIFFGIVFTDGNIMVKTIESVEELMKEGDTLHHCVYTNEYHKKPDSLILSARIDNKPLETIEVSLKTFKVLQSRGLQNNPSKYHDNIVNLVQQNIGVIKKIKSAKNLQRVAV